MKPRLIIRPDHTSEELAEIHNEILQLNPHIRVNSRWGDFTEYSVRLKRAHVVEILGGDPPDGRTYRLVFGVNDGVTVDLQIYDPEARDWESMIDSVFWEVEFETLDERMSRILGHLRAYHPDTETLVEIDTRLLGEGTI